jgi:hypothetical protein
VTDLSTGLSTVLRSKIEGRITFTDADFTAGRKAPQHRPKGLSRDKQFI